MAAPRRLWITDLSMLLQPFPEDPAARFNSPYEQASLSLPFLNPLDGTIDTSTKGSDHIKQSIQDCFASWEAYWSDGGHNHKYPVGTVSLLFTEEGGFKGPKALVIRAASNIIEQLGGDKLDRARLPDSVRNPRAALTRDFPSLWDTTELPKGSTLEMGDTCPDNHSGRVTVIESKRWIPVDPALYGTEDWSATLGPGRPLLFHSSFIGDLYDGAFNKGASGRSILIRAVEWATAAARMPILNVPAAASASSGVGVGAGGGIAPASPEEKKTIALGETGPILLVSHLGKWTSGGKSDFAKRLHYHHNMETETALRAHFQTDRALRGALPGDETLCPELSSVVFFYRTSQIREHLDNNAPKDGSAGLYVATFDIRPMGGHFHSDLKYVKKHVVTSTEKLEANFKQACKEAYQALTEDRIASADANEVLAGLPESFEEITFRFLTSPSQARIAVWVGRSNNGSKEDKDKLPINDGIPEAWRVFLTQQCLLNLYKQTTIVDDKGRSGGHLAVRTGSRYDRESEYFEGLRDVLLTAADPAWGAPMGFLQLPLGVHYRILRGFASADEATTKAFLLPGSTIPAADEWLAALEKEGLHLIT
jgi:hypothetical protein